MTSAQIGKKGRDQVLPKDLSRILSVHGDISPTAAAEISSLFDITMFRKHTGDQQSSAEDALLRYLTDPATWTKLAPCVLFDPVFYLNRNADVLAAGLNPLLHFVLYGANERRSPHPLFDLSWYAAKYAIDGQITAKVLVYFMNNGAKDNLSPHPLFDSAWYLQNNPDVRAAGINPLIHYLQIGAAEGRNPHPVFSNTYYAQQKSLDFDAINPLVHFVQASPEGRADPHPLFDLNYYLRITLWR